MITWKKAALAAAAAALALATAGAVAGGVDSRGRWNPDLPGDVPSRSYTPPLVPAPTKPQNLYEDVDFDVSEIRIDGKTEKILKYKDWIGFVAADDSLFLFKPQANQKYWWMWSCPLHAVNEPVKSVIILQEADCTERRHRDLQAVGYGQILGRGTPVRGDTVKAEWTYTLPGTVMDKWMSYFCSRR